MENTNISEKHRQGLLQLCEQVRASGTIEPHEVAQLENFISSVKYGLRFEKHEERVDQELRDNFPVLTDCKDKEICSKPGDKFNFLIEGDNLHSLKLLEKTHKGMIDVIYIDPPYNTGNKDFKYNDRYVDEEDGYYHSKWLSFMEERLLIAHKLLTSDGLMFISIDDSELYNLKLLCDSIFNAKNFVTTICVELSKTQGMKVRSAQNGTIVKNHEYILVYCKEIINATTNRCPLYDKADPYDEHFKLVLNDDMTTIPLTDYLKKQKQVVDEFEKYNIKLTGKNIGKLMSLSDMFNDFMVNTLSHKLYRLAMISSDEIQSLDIPVGQIVRYNSYLLVKNSKGTIEQLQSYRDTLHITDEYKPEYCRATIRGALWKGFYSDMMNVAKEGDVEFKNGKKPKRLIKQLLKYANRPNATVLDFFAGSGTTGQAVLELNKEDNGNRKFILCTNSENNICEDITYRRLKTIITGVRHNGLRYSDGIPANLKYFKCDLVNKGTEDVDDILMEKATALIELENHIDLNDASIAIIYDEEELDDLLLDFDNQIKHIYISSDVATTGEQEQFLDEHKVQVTEIPHHYYKEV